MNYMTSFNRLKSKTTFCLGYWHIQQNKKHNIEHYLNLIPETLLSLEDTNMVFFYNDEVVLDYIKKHKKTEQFIPIKLDFEELPTYSVSNNYLTSCKNQNIEQIEDIYSKNDLSINKEKGYKHFQREYLQSGEESFKKLFSIWTSKLLLIEETINTNPFDSEYFSWVDVSIARFNQKRKKWNFVENNYSKKYIYHYKSTMYYYGDTLNLNASYFFGHKKKWNTIIPLYTKQIEESKNSNYAHDEETLLNLVYKKNKKHFYKLDELTILDKIANKLKL